jgi:PBSX family phage portal protein
LPRAMFTRWAHDFLVFGNGYIERRDNRLGDPLNLDCPLAKYVRRGIDPGTYWYVAEYGIDHEFKPGSVFHLAEPDIHQDIYGLPYYLAGLNSAWLNESATLFRRKYYKNGSHAGFILYMTDTAQDQADIDALRKALKDSKGPGNFRNLFMYAPGGKKDGIQIIPVAEVTAKDEFFNIKMVTRDDQLAAHRVPPQLMGVVPANTGGFGDALRAAQVFAANELEPLQGRFMELNEWLGEEVIRFRPYALAAEPEAPPRVM